MYLFLLKYPKDVIEIDYNKFGILYIEIYRSILYEY